MMLGRAAAQLASRRLGAEPALVWRSLSSRGGLGAAACAGRGPLELVGDHAARVAARRVLAPGVLAGFLALAEAQRRRDQAAAAGAEGLALVSRDSGYDTAVPWWRLAWRVCRLGAIAAPALATMPAALLLSRPLGLSSAEHYWWALFVRSAELAGPMWIKLAQWASTREDLFRPEQLANLARLRDAVRPHAWADTVRALDAAFGRGGWERRLLISERDRQKVLGSGCIAQVYKGELDGRSVAVKVIHPAVREAVTLDLALLRGLARLLERRERWRYLGIADTAEQFCRLLTTQLDLSIEAENLRRLGANFAANDRVIVPAPQDGWVTDTVLVETFVEGDVMMDIIKGGLSSASRSDAAVKLLAKRAVDAVLDMVFQHNFVHGDLHPGNVLVTRDAPGEGGDNKGPRIAILDAGICIELTESTHVTMQKVLYNFMTNNGREAARLMAEHADKQYGTAEGFARNLESFADGIDAMVKKAHGAQFYDKVMCLARAARERRARRAPRRAASRETMGFVARSRCPSHARRSASTTRRSASSRASTASSSSRSSSRSRSPSSSSRARRASSTPTPTSPSPTSRSRSLCNARPPACSAKSTSWRTTAARNPPRDTYPRGFCTHHEDDGRAASRGEKGAERRFRAL